MSKEEEKNLFDDISLNNDPDAIDDSFFMQDPETRNEESTDSKKDDKIENDNPDEKDLVDTSIFENIDDLDTEDSTSSNDDPSANNSSSPLQLVTKMLLAEGLITLDDGELEKIESAKDLLPAWRKKMLEEEFSDLNENEKTYLKALRNGIPDEDIRQNFRNLKELNKLTPEMIQGETGEELRKILITENYKAKGISDDEALKLASRSIELGEDNEDALSAFNSLKEIESKRIQEATEKAEENKKIESKNREEQLSKLKDKVLNTEEFIPGHKPNSTTKEKMFTNMSKIVDYDEKGNGLNAIMVAKRKDPEKFAMMESYLYTVTKGYTDFSVLKNTAKSSAIEEIDKQLKSSTVGGGTPKSIQSSTGKGLADAIKNFNI